MNLRQGILLQGGKYKIERVLGQGGFGITYLATQVGLNRKVAIKEFFMREYCNRDTDTSQVTVGSEGSRDVVDKFRSKFVKEAQNIACLKHPHIISIHDVFEENGTAYYVMEYLDRGSLAELVKQRGRLAEADALRYIRQIADALRYIHARNMNHLDVKPGNILIDETDGAVLIDFGLSKRYDDEGNQTSTTPVGISHGYAPLEQYKKGGVGTFSPSTDIILGATLYKLITGNTPPDANDVNDEGLSAFPSYVSPSVASAIEQTMQPRRKDRPQSVDAFLALLDAEEEVTVIAADAEECVPSLKQSKKPVNESKTQKRKSGLMVLLLSVIACAIVVLFTMLWPKGENIISTTPTSASSDNRTIYMVNGVEFAMVRVKGGEFMMGASENDAEANKDEKPAHQVMLNDYAIGETEVTQELWQAVMGSNPSKFANNPKHPVEQVSWHDCQEFILKLNSLTGVTFHLPTEAEWEYAARGGQFSKGNKYSGGDEIESIAWYDANASNTTHAVKGKQPNELGLYDMSGNVWEWCDDLYGSYCNTITSAQTNRVLRGGGWRNDPKGNRVVFRLNGNPGKQLYTIGMRLAMSIGEPNVSVTNEREYVDLGLSVKWATCNIGASSPSDYGNYYAWGETSTKSEYTEANSVTYDLSVAELKSRGIIGTDGNLTPAYDAARANWGGTWRMPTLDEMKELKEKCTWTWTSQGGHNGCRVTGPNGKSIFLPAAGVRNDTSLYAAGSRGNYWSATPDSDSDRAYDLYFADRAYGWYNDARALGFTVRPVSE